LCLLSIPINILGQENKDWKKIMSSLGEE